MHAKSTAPKTLGIGQIANLKASGVVRGMLHRRYEKNFMARQEQERRKRDDELIKIMLWEDIDENYMSKIRHCYKYYFRAQQKKEQDKLAQQETKNKKTYKSPSKIE